MKLNKQYIIHRYIVKGEKTVDANTSGYLTIRLSPKSPSIMLNFQKIKIEREILQKEQSSTPYKEFVGESAKILNDYELEFNSDKIPFRITDHDRIWQRWLKQSEILFSKFTGIEVNNELKYMTYILGDEKKLLPVLMNNYPLRELYGRELHKIKFDKCNICNRDWTEIAFCEELIFSQNCQLSITRTKDQLQINGKADLKENQKQIEKICQRANINIKHITSIDQETLYSGSNIALIPDSIKTRFTIRANEVSLKQETIEVTIKKDQ